MPTWVRSRGLTVYLTVFNRTMTAGSLAWDAFAEFAGLPAALLIAAVALAGMGLLMHLVTLPAGKPDLGAAQHLPAPLLAEPVAHDRGPAMVLIEYDVAPGDRQALLATAQWLAQERRRDGAYAWGVAKAAREFLSPVPIAAAAGTANTTVSGVAVTQSRQKIIVPWQRMKLLVSYWIPSAKTRHARPHARCLVKHPRLAPSALSRQTPEVGAECVGSTRPDLSGGAG